jgi:hypothetical protein
MFQTLFKQELSPTLGTYSCQYWDRNASRMIRQLPEQITNDRLRFANSDREWTRRKTFNRRSTQIYADNGGGNVIAAKSGLRPISPFSYVGQGHKTRKKED